MGIDYPGMYTTIMGLRAWVDDSGGPAHELAFTERTGILYRTGTHANGWGNWRRMLGEDDLGNVNIGFKPLENSEGWGKVLQIAGDFHVKNILLTSQVHTGQWAHDYGHYGALAGGIAGTYSNHAYSIMTNKVAKMVVLPDGNVGVGTNSPAEKLSVNGKIRAHEIKVEVTGWPDYVFEPNYRLQSLQHLKQYIKNHGHLPEIPKADVIEADGLSLGEMNKLLLKKVEELSLHLIEKDEQVQSLESRLQVIEQYLSTIKP